MSKSFWRLVLSVSLAGLAAAPLAAADDPDVPYWASLTADKVNMRAGPARDYAISWVYRRDNLPVKVVRLHEGWRLVEDPDGTRGWILSRFLSRARWGIVQGKISELREKPDGTGKLMWRVEPGVVGRLGDCQNGWCRFDVHGHKAYIAADAVWGDGEP
ncbi:SH3 domain-containing protein [Novosphingobium tardum]|uniref:SH3 domain-containing protein n=1 Tax=Novosphingobium tardum TaxID=1538021 RepID=A0ABV8RQF2_9SPHN